MNPLFFILRADPAISLATGMHAALRGMWPQPFFSQNRLHLIESGMQPTPVVGEDKKIVRVTDVPARPYALLNVMVEPRQEQVGEKLAREGADRQSVRPPRGRQKIVPLAPSRVGLGIHP